MLTVTAATRIYIVAGLTDMRNSFYCLQAIVENELRRNARKGDSFVFSNRRRDRLNWGAKLGREAGPKVRGAVALKRYADRLEFMRLLDTICRRGLVHAPRLPARGQVVFVRRTEELESTRSRVS